MASYVGHLSCSALLGAAWGSFGIWSLGLDWGPAFLGAGLTAVAGLLPDLDSDSGVPVRELFSLLAAVVPVFLFERVRERGFTTEQTLVLLGGVYVFIRYGARHYFRRVTVHRGMFHSIPALLLVGTIVFLMYHNPDRNTRLFMAGGAMIGFLSHLVLDELCSVDLTGGKVRLNRYAGSALKLFSPSAPATLTTWLLLGLLGWAAWAQW